MCQHTACVWCIVDGMEGFTISRFDEPDTTVPETTRTSYALRLPGTVVVWVREFSTGTERIALRVAA